jgi:hypothetical protein
MNKIELHTKLLMRDHTNLRIKRQNAKLMLQTAICGNKIQFFIKSLTNRHKIKYLKNQINGFSREISCIEDQLCALAEYSANCIDWSKNLEKILAGFTETPEPPQKRQH